MKVGVAADCSRGCGNWICTALMLPLTWGSRGSQVQVIPTHLAGNSDQATGIIIPTGATEFPPLQNTQTGSATPSPPAPQPSIQCASGRKVHPLPPSSDQLKNEWSCTSTSLIHLFTYEEICFILVRLNEIHSL